MKFGRGRCGHGIAYGIVGKRDFRLLDQAPWLGGKETGEAWPMDGVHWLAPCEPSKVIGVAINYPGSSGELPKMQEPLVFLKPASSIAGPKQPVICPFPGWRVWGESELAVIVRRKLSKANRNEAQAAIFGYTIANDVTADNIHDWDHHLARSKGIDTFCPIGPFVQTELDLETAYIRGFHNGVLLREGQALFRRWQDDELLSMISSWMTLEAGDVVLTGAPNRVRDRLYLKDGDQFTCAVDGLGELTNRFTVRST